MAGPQHPVRTRSLHLHCSERERWVGARRVRQGSLTARSGSRSRSTGSQWLSPLCTNMVAAMGAGPCVCQEHRHQSGNPPRLVTRLGGLFEVVATLRDALRVAAAGEAYSWGRGADRGLALGMTDQAEAEAKLAGTCRTTQARAPALVSLPRMGEDEMAMPCSHARGGS